MNTSRPLCVAGIAFLDIFFAAGFYYMAFILMRWRWRILKKGFLPLPGSPSGKLEFAVFMAGMNFYFYLNSFRDVVQNGPGVEEIEDHVARFGGLRTWLLMRLPATFVLAPDVIYALIHAVAATISYRNPAAVLELVARRLERHSAVH